MFQYLPKNPSLIYSWKTHEPTFPSSFGDHSSIILNAHNTSSSLIHHLQPHSHHHHHINNLDEIALVSGQNPDHDQAPTKATREEEKPKKAKKASDRHSKIAVKNRLRHRRTRLSIEVARQLFELQDMLGFERASKAVEWLLHRARTDITKLRRERDPSLNSDGEPVDDVEIKATTTKSEKKEHRRSRSSSSSSSRSTYSVAVAKAAREMARKRARDRTLFKRSRMITTGSNSSWQSVESSWVNNGFHEPPQQLIPCGADNLAALPDDLFQDIGMSFEMTTIPSLFCV